jgi:two-component system, sensor histidine kinase
VAWLEAKRKVVSDSSIERREDYSRLIANLTHELKTPLHSILAIASILASEVDGPLTAEQRRQVEMITRNGEHLLEQITELLQFSTTATETRRANLRQIKVRVLFDEVLRSIEPVAKRANVSVESDIERLKPDFWSDTTLLRRIVVNLLSNAVKFSPDGGNVSFFAQTLNDSSLEVQVADSGIGMRTGDQSAIFAEFFQADSGDTRRFGGVGLGLTLVKAALDLLGGRVDVKSEPGRGSLFTVHIPSALATMEKRKVLVVEPDEGVRLSLHQCFAGEGYETVLLPTRDEVVRYIAELKPDLVMLDVSDSQGEGFALVEQIRSSAWGEAIPVIVMSTLEGPKERARGFKAGASDFIVKPFDVEELIARVRTQLERPW